MVDKIERELVVVAIHGEGDRATVNSLQQHRNAIEVQRMLQANLKVPSKLEAVPDEPPDVLVVLRDSDNPAFRIDWPVETWDEVDKWKIIAGFDPSLRHWKSGAKVKVTLS